MINQHFMRALAQLEAVSYTQQEKDIINAVRGKYVAKFGAENPFIQSLAQLESVAATQAERDEINTIRGKYALMEMQDMQVQTETDVDPVTKDTFKETMTTDASDTEGAPLNWDYTTNTPIDPDERDKPLSNSFDMDWRDTITPDYDPKLAANNRPYSDDPSNSINNWNEFTNYDEVRSILGNPDEETDLFDYPSNDSF